MDINRYDAISVTGPKEHLELFAKEMQNKGFEYRNFGVNLSIYKWVKVYKEGGDNVVQHNLRPHNNGNVGTFELPRDWSEVLKFKPHKEKPLFTTEDGIDIYKGDTYYYVDNIDWDGVYSRIGGDRSGGVNHYIYFSTKEKAEEYLNENKPMYSKAQVKKAYKKSQLNGLSIIHNLER